MSYYKLETTHSIVAISNRKVPYKSKRTYKYFCGSYENMIIRLEEALKLKAKVTVKEISEHDYVKGTR